MRILWRIQTLGEEEELAYTSSFPVTSVILSSLLTIQIHFADAFHVLKGCVLNSFRGRVLHGIRDGGSGGSGGVHERKRIKSHSTTLKAYSVLIIPYPDVSLLRRWFCYSLPLARPPAAAAVGSV